MIEEYSKENSKEYQEGMKSMCEWYINETIKFFYVFVEVVREENVEEGDIEILDDINEINDEFQTNFNHAFKEDTNYNKYRIENINRESGKILGVLIGINRKVLRELSVEYDRELREELDNFIVCLEEKEEIIREKEWKGDKVSGGDSNNNFGYGGLPDKLKPRFETLKGINLEYLKEVPPEVKELVIKMGEIVKSSGGLDEDKMEGRNDGEEEDNSNEYKGVGLDKTKEEN